MDPATCQLTCGAFVVQWWCANALPSQLQKQATAPAQGLQLRNSCRLLHDLPRRAVQVDDPTNFGPSLNRCPKLEMFSAYKVRPRHALRQWQLVSLTTHTQGQKQKSGDVVRLCRHLV